MSIEDANNEWTCAEELGSDDTPSEGGFSEDEDCDPAPDKTGAAHADNDEDPASIDTVTTFTVFGDDDAVLDNDQCHVVYPGVHVKDITQLFGKNAMGSPQPYAVVCVADENGESQYYRGIQSLDGSVCAVLTVVTSDNAAAKALHGAPLRKSQELAETCRDMWKPSYKPPNKACYVPYMVGGTDRFMIISTANAAIYLRRAKKNAEKASVQSAEPSSSTPKLHAGKKRTIGKISKKLVTPWGENESPAAKKLKSDKLPIKTGPAKHHGSTADKTDGSQRVAEPPQRGAKQLSAVPSLFTAEHAATLDRIGAMFAAFSSVI